MNYNFDLFVERKGTDCVKYERPKALTGCDNLLPLWVADMDFETPPFVLQAIQKRLDQKIMGYTCPNERYYQAIQWWVKHRYGMCVEETNLHYIPGIVPGVCFAINTFSKENDGVLIQPPVYYPFQETIEASRRKCVTNNLIVVDGKPTIDYADFEEKLKQVKLFILCHPHNPLGYEWEKEDLIKIAKLCAKHNVLVISDEIHADLMLNSHPHTPFAMVCEEAKENSVTFMAPSKVFNMPGITVSYSIVYNQQLREKFHHFLDFNHVAGGNVFAYDCTIACYSPQGDEWRKQMLSYIEKNIDYTLHFLKEQCPKLKVHRPIASFLLWINFKDLGFPTHQAMTNFLIQKAKLYLNDGESFGSGGSFFMRLNLASPRSIIEEAMQRLKKAYDSLY